MGLPGSKGHGSFTNLNATKSFNYKLANNGNRKRDMGGRESEKKLFS